MFNRTMIEHARFPWQPKLEEKRLKCSDKRKCKGSLGWSNTIQIKNEISPWFRIPLSGRDATLDTIVDLWFGEIEIFTGWR